MNKIRYTYDTNVYWYLALFIYVFIYFIIYTYTLLLYYIKVTLNPSKNGCYNPQISRNFIIIGIHVYISIYKNENFFG